MNTKSPSLSPHHFVTLFLALLSMAALGLADFTLLQ